VEPDRGTHRRNSSARSRLGTDKDFGDPRVTGERFYTSLVPWEREVSRLDRIEPLLRKQSFRVEHIAVE
jgi:hypothetical protein